MNSSLNEKHYKLAETFGVSRSQISFFDSLEELRRIAASRDIAEAEIVRYTEETYGLNIRDHAESGVLNCEIFIRKNGHINGARQTYERLINRNLEPSIWFLDNSGEMFYAFVLLHEIAHALLNHDAPNSSESYERDENAADQWAYSILAAKKEFLEKMIA